jgi:hypothetical protein
MSRHLIRRRPSVVAAARLGFAGGAAVMCAGIGLLAGLAVALIVAGGVVAVSCLLLVDVGGRS